MTPASFSLKGKNALVTGSQQGLGAAIAIGLANAGANIALHGRDAVPEEVCESVHKAGVKSISLTGDVGDPKTCARLVEGTVSGLGSVDILVNNAGIIRRAPAVDFAELDWQDVINVNLTSVFRLCQIAGRHMLKQGSGKIINIAS